MTFTGFGPHALQLLRRTSLAVGRLDEAGDWLFDARCRERVLQRLDVVQRWNRWLDEHVGG